MSFARKMDGTGDHHVKQNKPDGERQISHILSYAESEGLLGDKEELETTGESESEGHRGVNMIKIIHMLI
jgi:hypothetical protein